MDAKIKQAIDYIHAAITSHGGVIEPETPFIIADHLGVSGVELWSELQKLENIHDGQVFIMEADDAKLFFRKLSIQHNRTSNGWFVETKWLNDVDMCEIKFVSPKSK